MATKTNTATEEAYRQGLAKTKTLGDAEQKRLGQYMTPPPIARFMAARALQGLERDTIRILEPAAGSGVLAAASVEALIARPVESRPKRIELLLCELDGRLAPVLSGLGAELEALCQAAGITLDYSVQGGDFLLSPTALEQKPLCDIVIANPPYFKLAGADQRAKLHSYAVHGQPNIYALFMAACARLVAPGGRWCFITPRSWTNGAYFAATRRHLLANIRLDAVHIFESRQAHFEDDAILQEAVIAWGTSHSRNDSVLLSTSQGSSDLHLAELRPIATYQLVGADDDRTITLPSKEATGLETLSGTLESHGLRVSTGPVVAFRAVDC